MDGADFFQASQHSLPWESGRGSYQSVSMLPDFAHTPAQRMHLQKYTLTSMHTPGAAVLFTLSKPALKDNKHTVNNM